MDENGTGAATAPEKLPELSAWQKDYWNQIYTAHQVAAQNRDAAMQALQDAEVTLIGFVRTINAEFGLPSNAGILPDGTISVPQAG